MKLIILLLFVAFSIYMTSCSIKNKVDYGPDNTTKIDVIKELYSIKDSLNYIGEDTILVLYYGCSGCMDGIEEKGYIFWPNSRTISSVIKVTNTTKFKDAIKTSDVFEFLIHNKDGIINEGLANSLEYDTHFNYLLIAYYEGDIELFKQKLEDTYRNQKNYNKKLLLSVFQIESSLFKIESSILKGNKGW